jgi:hypothetical protein
MKSFNQEGCGAYGMDDIRNACIVTLWLEIHGGQDVWEKKCVNVRIM